MPQLPSAVPVLLGFLSALFVLAWLSRQVSIHIQLPVYVLTRSSDAPTIALFLFFLPGVIIHESAHWGVARLLGLKTGKFRVWPRRRGKYIGLGSVSVQSAGPLADSIVGMAPLVVGSLFVGLIAQRIFNAHDMALLLADGRWLAGLTAFWRAFDKPDGVLWAYLLFTIANAMMPSASDREPLRPVLLYGAVAALLYFVLGLPSGPVTVVIDWLTPNLVFMTTAFLFTITLDILVLGILYLIRLIISG